LFPTKAVRDSVVSGRQIFPVILREVPALNPTLQTAELEDELG